MSPVTQFTGDLDRCLARMDFGRAFKQSLLMQSSEQNIPYRQPLIDAVELFEELKIEYALVGGIAAMFYGRPRFTEDIDFVAATGHMEVLAKNPEAMRSHHFDSGSTWKLYHDSGLEIDLWKDEFSDAIVSSAENVELAGRNIRLANPLDLIAMKLRANRIRDDYDISEILLNNEIDIDAIRSRVNAEQFAHFESINRRIQK